MQRLAATGKISRVVHFNEYAIVLAAALAVRGRGIATTFASMASIRGVDRRRIVLMPDPLAIMGQCKLFQDWVQWRELRLSPETIKEVADDCMFRSAGNASDNLSADADRIDGATRSVNLLYRRIAGRSWHLPVLSTRSLQIVSISAALKCEPFSDRQPFRDQIEWLAALIERVELSQNLQLIVRIHPREGANRREAVVSSHLGLLKSDFPSPTPTSDLSGPVTKCRVTI